VYMRQGGKMIACRRPAGSGSVIIATLAILGVPPGSRGQTSQPQSDARAVSFIDAWIDALGGMQHLQRMVAARFTLTTDMYEASSGRLRRT